MQAQRASNPNGSEPTATRRDQTNPTGDSLYDAAAVRFCSKDCCSNYKDLKQCGRCKAASYCSVECQRESWKKHKPLCDFNASQVDTTTDEPPLQRILRHWVVRFGDATLAHACIRGLNLKYEWENLDKAGIVLLVEPRPHANQGARLRVVNASVMRNEEILKMFEGLGQAERYRNQVLPMHVRQRERIHKETDGKADYAMVVILATNTGPNALDGDHSATLRIKPVDVYRVWATAMPRQEYEGDWAQELKHQVDSDTPMKRRRGKVV
ncbi:hypothetical protein B0H15DRAFT_833400 [Mycena belliarum]|uniref:MYND-type domain-containing protein n=1 Tax=Mycena belliarum TaxID=1033014 RepID=A0AAD6U7U5_9AGAR|nr:hypothetical protein B0H15DRAFT_833400 [Mycena belliae]